MALCYPQFEILLQIQSSSTNVLVFGGLRDRKRNFIQQQRSVPFSNILISHSKQSNILIPEREI